MPALKSFRNTFDRNLESAELLFQVAIKFTCRQKLDKNTESPILPGQANRIAGLAFLLMVRSWEELVEACLARYVMGVKAPSGAVFRMINSHLPARRISEAYDMLKSEGGIGGGSGYLSVSEWKKVEKCANEFLHDGQPFSSITDAHRQHLRHAIAVRNRVAHDSKKCRNSFLEVASYHGDTKGKRPRGYSVGHLLLKESNTGFGKNASKQAIFHHYLQQFREMADIICPMLNISGRNTSKKQ